MSFDEIDMADFDLRLARESGVMPEAGREIPPANQVMVPENKPFFYPGGQTGVLLVHGFSSGPSQMNQFGAFMQACNVTTRGVLLAGHGTTPEHLRDTTWPEWYASLEQAYFEMIAYGCKQIFVAGLSLGGTLALHLAAERKVDGIIPINAPIYLPNFIKTAVEWGAKLVPYTTKVFSDVADPSQQNVQRGYHRTPVEVYGSMVDCLNHVRTELPRITAPALIIYARKDHIVPSSNSHYIYQNISSRSKKLVVLHRSFHVATIDYDRGDVFARTLEFMQQHGALGVRGLMG